MVINKQNNNNLISFVSNMHLFGKKYFILLFSFNNIDYKFFSCLFYGHFVLFSLTARAVLCWQLKSSLQKPHVCN